MRHQKRTLSDKTSVQVDRELLARIEKYVGSQGRSKADVIRRALDALDLKIHPLPSEVGRQGVGEVPA